MDSIRLYAGTVVRVVDSITEKGVDTAGVTLDGERIAARSKENGYYLFSRRVERGNRILVTAKGYVPLVYEATGQETQTIPTCSLRPAADYPLGSELYGIRGKTRPNRVLTIVCREVDLTGTPRRPELQIQTTADAQGSFLCIWKYPKPGIRRLLCQLQTEDTGEMQAELLVKAGTLAWIQVE